MTRKHFMVHVTLNCKANLILIVLEDTACTFYSFQIISPGSWLLWAQTMVQCHSPRRQLRPG